MLLPALAAIFVLDSGLAQPENPGPRQPGWTSVTIQRSGRSLNCRLYYPSFVEGQEAPIDTVHGPYPIVAFGHGFFMQTSYYISQFRQLATHGFVVIAPQFPDTQHGELADDLLYCAEYLRQQHSTTGSRFRGLLDTALVGLSGHSMGGGASLLAAARDTRVRAVAPLAAAETSPSAIAVMNQIHGVTYLLAGASDGITPPATNQIRMYNNANPVKGLVLIHGANHTRFMDVATFDFTDPNGWLTRPEQLRITRRYLTSVFSLTLKSDSTFWIYTFGDSARFDSSISFSYELGTTRVEPVATTESFVLRQNYPNPFNPATNVTFSLQASGFTLLKVYDLLGREVATLVNEQLQPGTYSVTFDGAGFSSGIYVYWMSVGGFTMTRKMLLLR